jgi:hypothetical protein
MNPKKLNDGSINGQSDHMAAFFNKSLLDSTQNTFDNLKNIEDGETTVKL